MTTQVGIEYLTKADAAHWFTRSERSLSRDITNAIKFRDLDVLKHVRLRLEDGTIRPGSEITIDEIIRLRDEGQNPTWELAVSWLEARFGKRGDTPQEEDGGGGRPSWSVGDTPQSGEAAAKSRQLPAEPALRLAVLEAITVELETRNQEKDDQIRRLETELDRRAEERREENELQKQNNVLMQQIYNLLSTMQESSGEASLIKHPQRQTLLPLTTASEQGQREAVKVDDTPDSRPATAPKEASRTAPNTPRTLKQRAAARKTTAAKRSAPVKPASPKVAKKSASKLFPTFGRAVRSFLGR